MKKKYTIKLFTILLLSFGMVPSLFSQNINHVEQTSLTKFRINLGELEKLGLLKNKLSSIDKTLEDASLGDEAQFFSLLKDDNDKTFSIYKFIPCFSKDYFYHSDLKIKFSPSNLITTTNDYSLYDLEVDFGDGKGKRLIDTEKEQILDVKYGDSGKKNISIILTLKSNRSTVISTETVWNVAFNHSSKDDSGSTKAGYLLPNFTMTLVGTTPYVSPCDGNQGVARGKAHVLYAQGNNKLTQPVVFVEGIDFSNAVLVESDYSDTLRFGGFGWDSFVTGVASGLPAIAMLPQVVDSLRFNGHDVILLDFKNGSDYIQKNAELFEKLIHQLNDSIMANGNSCPVIDVIGTSMGGIVSRYGIMRMEKVGYKHHIKNFVSFDSPQKGANIPLAIQSFAHFIGVEGGNAGALQSWNKLNSPAARQLVKFHKTYYPATNNCVFDDLYGEMDLYGMPKYTVWNVGVANGSGVGAVLPFGAGDFLLDCDYDPWYLSVSMVAKMYASNGRVMSGGNNFFHGKFDDNPTGFFEAIEDDYFYPASTPLADNAPGGLTDIIEADVVPSITASISASNINTYQPVTSFIPTISSLAIASPWSNMHNPIIGGSLESLIPFDDYFAPTQNEMHVQITNDNMNFIFSKIKRLLPTESENPVICQGESYVYNGTTYTTQGVYTNYLLNQEGCDSVKTTISLTVNPIPVFTTIASDNSVDPGDNVSLWVSGAGIVNLSWTMPDGSISTIFNPQLTFPAGSDSVVVSVAVSNANCTVYDSITIYSNQFISLGLDELSKDHISVYPNPITDGILNIKSKFQLDQIKIYDMVGRLVFETESQQNLVKLDLNHLSKGSYKLEVGKQNPKVFSLIR